MTNMTAASKGTMALSKLEKKPLNRKAVADNRIAQSGKRELNVSIAMPLKLNSYNGDEKRLSRFSAELHPLCAVQLLAALS
jgi:hypothetical protein